MRGSATAIFGFLLLGAAASAPAGAAPAGPGGVPSAEAGRALPVAMCGYSCRSGGRYIPGPPSVCYEEGLRYCGSSRDRGPPPYVERRPRVYDDYYDAPRRGPPGLGIYIR